MHLIVTLIVFVGLAAIIVWVADWTSGGAHDSPQRLTFTIDLARGASRQDRIRSETKASLRRKAILTVVSAK